MMRVVLGEGYPYPLYATKDFTVGEEAFGVQLFDAEGRVRTLDRTQILHCQLYRCRVVLEVLDLGETGEIPATLEIASLPRPLPLVLRNHPSEETP